MKATIEEYAEKRFPSKQEMYDVFIEGAQWQAEQMYTEEDMKNMYDIGGQQFFTERGAFELVKERRDVEKR